MGDTKHTPGRGKVNAEDTEGLVPDAGDAVVNPNHRSEQMEPTKMLDLPIKAVEECCSVCFRRVGINTGDDGTPPVDLGRCAAPGGFECRAVGQAVAGYRRENEVLRSNSDHLSSENASLAQQVESMGMRLESLAEELAKPEDVRLREVLDALDGRAGIFDGLGARVGHLLDEMDEWIERAGAAERRLKKAEDVVLMARQLTAYAWEDRLEDCEVSDSAKHDLRELSTAVWLYDQEAKS